MDAESPGDMAAAKAQRLWRNYCWDTYGKAYCSYCTTVYFSRIFVKKRTGMNANSPHTTYLILWGWANV